MRGWIVAGLVVLAVSGAGLRGRDDVQPALADMTVDEHAPDAFSRMQRARPAETPAKPAKASAAEVAPPTVDD